MRNHSPRSNTRKERFLTGAQRLLRATIPRLEPKGGAAVCFMAACVLLGREAGRGQTLPPGSDAGAEDRRQSPGLPADAARRMGALADSAGKGGSGAQDSQLSPAVSRLRPALSAVTAQSDRADSPTVGSSLVTMETLEDKHKLAAGDRVSFRILEDQVDPQEPLDPKSMVVSDSGELEVPCLGRFPAAGKTCRQLARDSQEGSREE